MKTSLSLCFALVALSSAHAQVFAPGSVSVAGRSATVQQAAPRGGGERGGDHRGGDGGRRGSDVHVGVGYGYGPRGYDYGRGYYGHSHYYDRHYYGGYGYGYAPTYSYYGGYGYGYPYYSNYGYYPAGSAATNGLLLGAIAGGIIGNNSGDFRHNGWRGAAWGAGAGWLLGSVIDANRRAVVYESAPVVVQQAPVTQVQAQPAQAQPQPVTIINNYYNTSTPMSGVNGMFGR